jgi:hypothetical protein
MLPAAATLATIITLAACATSTPPRSAPPTTPRPTTTTPYTGDGAEFFVTAPHEGGGTATIRLVASGCAISAASENERFTVPLGSEASMQAWASGQAQEMVVNVHLWATLCPGKTYVVQANTDCKLYMDGPSRCRP